MTAPDDAETRPLLTVVNADATPEEVAALVAVFSSLGTTAPPPKPRSTWASYVRRVRPPLHQGRGAWRASGLPR